MATLATLYGETPSNSPKLPIRAVMPLPAGHTFGTDNPDSSPFTIKSGASSLATSCVPIMWDSAGAVRKVLLTAIGTNAEADAALTVTDDASTSGSFSVDSAVLTTLITTGITVTVEAPDGNYAATIMADLLTARTTKTHSWVPFYVVLTAQDASCKLPDLGSLKGFISVYAGINVIDLDFLWTAAEITAPRKRLYFDKLTVTVPDGFQMMSKIKGTYWGEGPETAATPTVDLIPAVSSPPAGTSSHHTIMPMSGKVFRLSYFKETVTDTMPTWASDWCTNNGWFFVSSNTARTDQAGGYHGMSVSTPITFLSQPLPQTDATNMGNALDTRMTTFLTGFAAGDNTDWFEGSDDTPNATSWRSRVGNRDGGQTGGYGIDAFGLALESIQGREEFPGFVMNLNAGLADRQFSFMDFGPLPFSYGRWQALTPGVYLEWSMRPGGNGSSEQVLSFGTSDQTGWRKEGKSNYDPSLRAQDDEEMSTWGHLDPNHYIRYVGPVISEVEYLWSPFANLMLRYAASAAIMHTPSPLDSYHSYGAGRGAEIGRAAGWFAYTLAAMYAYAQPSDRTKSIFRDARIWAEEIEELVDSVQMPNGGIIAWGAVGNNKEYKVGRKDVLGGGLVAAAEAAGFTPPGGGAWDDYDYQSDSGFATLLGMFSDPAIEAVENTVDVPRVAQSYQESILHTGLFVLNQAMGLGLIDNVLKSIYATMVVYRGTIAGETPGTDDTTPFYLVGVYPERKPTQVSMSSADVVALYCSMTPGSIYDGTSSERSAYNYRTTLGLAASLSQPNAYALAYVLAIAAIMDADYETTADDSVSLARNGEALLAIQQITA